MAIFASKVYVLHICQNKGTSRCRYDNFYFTGVKLTLFKVRENIPVKIDSNFFPISILKKIQKLLKALSCPKFCNLPHPPLTENLHSSYFFQKSNEKRLSLRKKILPDFFSTFCLKNSLENYFQFSYM